MTMQVIQEQFIRLYCKFLVGLKNGKCPINVKKHPVHEY